MTDFTLGPGPLTPEFEQVKSDIGIVENGNTATHAIPSGYYVIWKGDLYVAKTDISSGTALGSSNLTAKTAGLGGELYETLRKFPVTNASLGLTGVVARAVSLGDSNIGIFPLSSSGCQSVGLPSGSGTIITKYNSANANVEYIASNGRAVSSGRIETSDNSVTVNFRSGRTSTTVAAWIETTDETEVNLAASLADYNYLYVERTWYSTPNLCGAIPIEPFKRGYPFIVGDEQPDNNNTTNYVKITYVSDTKIKIVCSREHIRCNVFACR